MTLQVPSAWDRISRVVGSVILAWFGRFLSWGIAYGCVFALLGLAVEGVNILLVSPWAYAFIGMATLAWTIRIRPWHSNPTTLSASIAVVAFLVGTPWVVWWYDGIPQRRAEDIVSRYEASSGKDRGQLYAEFVERDLADTFAEFDLPELAEAQKQLTQKTQTALQPILKQIEEKSFERNRNLTEEQRIFWRRLRNAREAAATSRRESGDLTEEEIQRLADRISLVLAIQAKRESEKRPASENEH